MKASTHTHRLAWSFWFVLSSFVCLSRHSHTTHWHCVVLVLIILANVLYPCDYSTSSLSLCVCLFVRICSFVCSLFRSDEFKKCEKTTEAMDRRTNVLETIITLELPRCSDPYNLRPDTRQCMSCPVDKTYEYVQLNTMRQCNTVSGLIQYA